MLSRRTDGNRSYFQADTACPFLPELRGIIDKTVGLAAQLRGLLEPFGAKVSLAFVFGSVARGAERSESDVDLMVVGSLGVKELVRGLRELEARIGRAVNIHTYTPQEFAAKVRAKHHFLTEVLQRDKLFVLGAEHELDGLLEARAG